MKKKIAIVLFFVAVFAAQAVSDPPVKESEFTFARVQFNMKTNWRYFYREAPWHHDYPFSDTFVTNVLQEVTSVRTTPESYQTVQLDSPELFQYPFGYFSEPGFMELTDEEMNNLREWFNRGGFACFDDFRGQDLYNLQTQMKRVFPDRTMVRLDVSEPIFHAFYDIDSLAMDPPYRNLNSGTPTFWGLRDDTGRLLLIANADNDLGEFFEWVDRGEMPFQPAALATRLTVNYLIYALTH